MEGHGAYNRSSCVQAAGSSPAVPLLEQAARLVDLKADAGPVVIADYGSSQGHNSFGPMAAAIRRLRERTDCEISVVHTDLPGNDFSALFQALAAEEQSYLRAAPKVFASAVGRSFYEQILPSGSVTLGWSSWAVQWLSRIPCAIPDHVQAAFSRDETARAVYARQAAEDWRMFLSQRGHELHPGGRLVVLTMAMTDDGDFGYGPLLEAIHASLRQMAAEGFVTEEELHRMAIPTVGRKLAEFLEPFSGAEGFAGLTIEHAEVFLGADSIWDRFERERDARAFGAQWAAFSRASVLPTLALALEGGSGDPRTAEFLDRTEAGMAARLAAAPEKMTIPLGALVLVRNQSTSQENTGRSLPAKSLSPWS